MRAVREPGPRQHECTVQHDAQNKGIVPCVFVVGGDVRGDCRNIRFQVDGGENHPNVWPPGHRFPFFFPSATVKNSSQADQELQ